MRKQKKQSDKATVITFELKTLSTLHRLVN